MANTRDSSKQKRARQNRAQREAREARTKAASVPADERKAKYASATPTTEAAPKKKGGFFSPPEGAAQRPPRPGDVPVDVDALEGSWYQKRRQVPGGRQVLMGALLTVILVPLMATQKYPEPNTPKGEKIQYTQTITEYFGWSAFLRLGIPLVAALVAAQMILSPRRRRWWTGAAVFVATGLVVGIPFVFPAGFLYYAVMRSRKIEGPGRAETALADAADDDVEDDDLDELDADVEDHADDPSDTRRDDD